MADSGADEEWRECLAKGAFVETARRFDLIETMRFDPQDGVVDLDRHLARMKASADALDFPFDRHEARNDLQAATFRAGPSKVRLVLSRSGALAIEMRPLAPRRPEPVEVAIAPLPGPGRRFPAAPQDQRPRLLRRGARRPPARSKCCSAMPRASSPKAASPACSSRRGGRLVTPPLARGLLPGVLRARLIDEGQAEEGDLVEADLAGGFFIGNAVRGLVRARLRSAGAGAAP